MTIIRIASNYSNPFCRLTRSRVIYIYIYRTMYILQLLYILLTKKVSAFSSLRLSDRKFANLKTQTHVNWFYNFSGNPFRVLASLRKIVL